MKRYHVTASRRPTDSSSSVFAASNILTDSQCDKLMRLYELLSESLHIINDDDMQRSGNDAIWVLHYQYFPDLIQNILNTIDRNLDTI